MAAFLTSLLSLALVVYTALSLELNFYRNSCPQAEAVVRKVVEEHFQRDPSIPAGLLRLHFHDCFISGCDGSVLLDSNGDNIAEKEAPPNLSLRGFEVIDEIKAGLERECQGTVSCADILALATRDGVAMSGGGAYDLPTGRRDGTVSTITDVHLPDPASSVADAVAAFQTINLTLADLTTLLGISVRSLEKLRGFNTVAIQCYDLTCSNSGAHSVGFCHCLFFIDRLYDFKGTGFPDPDMDPTTLDILRKKCPRPTTQIFNISSDPKVFMNQMSSTPFTLDNSFFHSVLNGKAVLQLDQELGFTDVTSNLLARYSTRPGAFRRMFAKSMIKLGNVGVLTRQAGEIRLNCRKVNQRH